MNAASGAIPPVPPNTATLQKLVREWEDQISETLKPSSLQAAKSNLRARIKPQLGDCALPELTTKRLQALVTSLAAGKRSRKTIENILLTLSSILAKGRKWGYAIPKVSLSDLALPQDTSRRGRRFTFEEMHRIIHAADEPLATICFLLSTTGMRIGEALALCEQDLDFQQKLIHVQRSVYAGQLGTPKSEASIADLPMPVALEKRRKAFLAFRHYQRNDPGLLFLNRRGRPHSANKLREKKLRPLLNELEIPLAGFHAFRHAVASELIDAGAPITVVQAQLRHSDARITLGLYGHVIPASQRKAVGRLAARLGGQLLTGVGIVDSAV